MHIITLPLNYNIILTLNMVINIIGNQEVMIMDLTNEFGQVFNDYENRLFEIFRTVLDTAIRTNVNVSVDLPSPSTTF